MHQSRVQTTHAQRWGSPSMLAMAPARPNMDKACCCSTLSGYTLTMRLIADGIVMEPAIPARARRIRKPYLLVTNEMAMQKAPMTANPNSKTKAALKMSAKRPEKRRKPANVSDCERLTGQLKVMVPRSAGARRT